MARRYGPGPTRPVAREEDEGLDVHTTGSVDEQSRRPDVAGGVGIARAEALAHGAHEGDHGVTPRQGPVERAGVGEVNRGDVGIRSQGVPRSGGRAHVGYDGVGARTQARHEHDPGGAGGSRDKDSHQDFLPDAAGGVPAWW